MMLKQKKTFFTKKKPFYQISGTFMHKSMLNIVIFGYLVRDKIEKGERLVFPFRVSILMINKEILLRQHRSM